MINKSIGYLICESDICTANVTNLKDSKVNGKAIAEGILQTADERNRNGRFYPHEELFPQLTAPRTVELLNAKYLRAETGHPMEKDLARQSVIDDKITCAMFLKLWTEGSNVWARFTATNNQYGHAFDLDLKEGCCPAWSLRALGNIENTRRGAEVKNPRLITWDNVIYPSHPGAYTQRVCEGAVEDNGHQKTHLQNIAESTNLGNKKSNIIVPVSNESVLKYLQTESANLKFIRECFDFAYKSIVVSESGTKVTLSDNNGDLMVINMEDYIHNELMRYSDEFSSLIND